MKNLDTEKLRNLCIRHHWFEHGTNLQYDRLFQFNSQGASLHELALIIWVCSDDSVENIERTIFEEVKKNQQSNTELIHQEEKETCNFNYYVVCMLPDYVRDSQMLDTISISDEMLFNIDPYNEVYENFWHDMEPIPFIAVVNAESEEAACKIAGSNRRYDPRILYATKIDIPKKTNDVK